VRPADPTFVSVIVPVFRDWAALPHCLTALEGQTYRSGGYEVIVIDNDGDLSSGAALDLDRYSHVRLVREP
jgi:glycosyltransferase involved in cell wall biosynthesis